MSTLTFTLNVHFTLQCDSGRTADQLSSSFIPAVIAVQARLHRGGEARHGHGPVVFLPNKSFACVREIDGLSCMLMLLRGLTTPDRYSNLCILVCLLEELRGFGVGTDSLAIAIGEHTQIRKHSHTHRIQRSRPQPRSDVCCVVSWPASAQFSDFCFLFRPADATYLPAFCQLCTG